jgi:hypothetical protein
MISPIGTATEEGVKTVPDIIRAAATSPLGIFALMIICLSVLGFVFFNKANQYVQLGVFLCLFGGVVAFGISINKEATTPNTSSSSPTPTPATPTPSPLKTATPTYPTTTTRADINAMKHPEQGHGFDRGYASTGDCSGPWVRGDARLEPNDTFVIWMELETDSWTQGAAGWLSFQLLDDKGNTLASGETDHQSIGPKTTIHARIEDQAPWRRQIPKDVADKVKRIEVVAHCGDPPWGLGPLTGQDVENGIRLIITAAGS